MKRTLLLLLLFSSAFASHCKEVEVNLLAVVGQEGSELTGNVLSATLKPIAHGKAGIFLEILGTKYDESLQSSLQYAYEAAKERAGEESCSFLVEFKGGTRELGGPSGGLVFALSFYEALTGEDLNLTSYGITGAIDAQGRVYPVGGVIEKTEAALETNLKGVIIPITDRFDYIFSWRFFDMERVHYALSLDDALSILEGGRGANAEEILFQKPAIEKKERSTYVYEFKSYYDEMKSTFSEALGNLDGEMPSSAEEYYEALLQKADEEAELGYYYTASNDIFVSGSELLALDSLINGRDVKEEAQECLSSIETFEPTKENFELVAGAKFRLQRAYNRINGESEARTLSEKAYLARDYAEALEWCKFARSLLEEARKKGGPTIVQEALRPEYLREINQIDPEGLDEESQEFYLSSLRAAAAGDYITALYHLAYLRSNLGKGEDIEEYRSFWGKVFASQAEYTGDERTLKLAQQLERVARFIRSSTAINELSLNVPEKSQEAKRQIDLIIYSQVLLIGVLLLGVIAWLKKR